MKMNGKLKKFICVLAVIALTAVNLAVLNYALRDDYAYSRYQPFMDRSEDIDVVFIGSSRVVNSVNPMQLWHDYGITSYNFGNSAFGIENSYWSFRLSLRHHIPKIAVLDVFGASRPETDKLQLGLAHNGLDMYPLSLEKVRAVQAIYADPADQLELLFPFSVFHNRWSGLTLASFLPSGKPPVTDTNGFEFFYAREGSVPQPQVPEGETLDLNDPPLGCRYIPEFIDLCRENGITPVLMFIPHEVEPERQREANTARLIAKEKDVAFWDLREDGFFNDLTDSADPNTHLNPIGAAKVTGALGERLSAGADGISAADHRGEAGYERWDALYDTYRQNLKTAICAEDSYERLLLRLADDGFGAYFLTFHGYEPGTEEQALIDVIPHNYGFESGNEAENPENCDLRVYVYDTETSEELKIFSFRRMTSEDTNLPLNENE